VKFTCVHVHVQVLFMKFNFNPVKTLRKIYAQNSVITYIHYNVFVMSPTSHTKLFSIEI
jgi:hypothetical protein